MKNKTIEFKKKERAFHSRFNRIKRITKSGKGDTLSLEDRKFIAAVEKHIQDWIRC